MSRRVVRASWLILLLLALAACAADPDSSDPTPDAGLTDGPGPPSPQPDRGPTPAPDTTPDSAPDWPELDPAEVKQKFDQLVAFATAEMNKAQVPGAAVAVLVGGKLAHVQGIGLRKQGGSEPVTADSLFALASTSKVFAGITAVALSQQGVIDLQAPISNHFPQVNLTGVAGADGITLHHLLTHTSGLGFGDEDLLYSLPIDWSSQQSMIEIFTKVPWPVWAPPGAVWNYNNAGYSLAGAVMQLAANKGYFDLVQDEVLTPLGMTTATLDGNAIQAADHTYGHSSYEPDPVAPDVSLIDYFSGPSNWVFCSARELARLAEVILAGGGPAPLSAEGVKTLTARHASLEHLHAGNAYGYGLEWATRRGVETLGHSGSNFGWTADLVLVPSQGIGAIVLMNSGDGNPLAVTDEAIKLFAQGPGQDPTPPPLGAAELAALAGSYQDAGELGDVTIAVSGNTLTATLPKFNETLTLHQYGVRAFYGLVSEKLSQALWGMQGLDLAFYLDAAGNGEFLVSRIAIGTRQP